MTEVYAERDGNLYTICARGHAGDVESCNYINGALYCFAGYAHNKADLLKFDVEDGYMLIKCRGDDHLQAAFEAAVIGLLELEDVRPEALDVSCVNMD